ncbi:MAG TPA: hypothetical protein VFM02_03810 [Candidatus Paceibacterota bacterium]|nr:hypothetical protein [Candidatus Paceibacterota bacterium]
MEQKKINLNESLKKLEEIAGWFDSQEEVDVEVGLQKVKEGAALIEASKKRLKEIENEFEEVKQTMEEHSGERGE